MDKVPAQCTAWLALAFPMNKVPAQLNRYQSYLQLTASLFQAGSADPPGA